MYNLRYHIASLVSVFLALSLGLVLGGVIVQRGTLDQQRTSLVEGLRKEFDDLRVENRSLKSENGELKSLSTAMVGAYSEGRLAGRTVVVVTNSGRSDGRLAAVETIEHAGGKVVSITLMKPQFGLTDEQSKAVTTSLAPDPARPIESIAASLAAEWTAPQEDRPLTKALTDTGIITVDGLDKAGASGIVDIAADGDKSDPAGIALIKAASDKGAYGIGAQTPATNTGVASAAAEAGLGAFDTLGTQVGRYTLVSLLNGAKPGYYGSADGADALFPPVTSSR